MRLNVKRYLEIISEKGIDSETVRNAVGLSEKAYQWIMENQNIEVNTLELIADAIARKSSEIYLPDSTNVNENVIEFLKVQKRATLTFSQGRYVSKAKKLAESHPDECQVVAENKDGSICAHVPVRWIKIIPPREYTEEERQLRGEFNSKNQECTHGLSQITMPP